MVINETDLNKSEFKIGQKLWFHNYDNRYVSDYIKIIKIGKKWIYTEGRKIDKQTLEVDGGQYSSPGKCYASKEQRDTQAELTSMWNNLKWQLERLRWSEGITLDVMTQIQKLLKLI